MVSGTMNRLQAEKLAAAETRFKGAGVLSDGFLYLEGNIFDSLQNLPANAYDLLVMGCLCSFKIRQLFL